MSPVVRVDDEVWNWLKTHARPLEDTPNSVLRRIAGIDPPLDSAAPPVAAPAVVPVKPPRPLAHGAPIAPAGPAVPRPDRRVTGEWLNRAFALGARQSLYHKDGSLYERLVRFPAILCDPKGYVRYETEQQFLTDSGLQIGEKVNVPRGLSGHARYAEFPRLAD